MFASGPALEIVQTAFPPAIGQSQIFSLSVAIVEILIGISYLSNKLDRIASIVMIVSVVLISIPVFITQGFDPRFPVLSLPGELVLKNLILIAAGLVLLSERNEEKKVDPENKKIPTKTV